MKSLFALLFSGAFRPLFLVAGLYAPLALLLWLGYLFGYMTLPAQSVNPLLWHSHEMIYGFVAAATGGFAFTAVANWTGRTPVQGTPLVSLCLLWMLGRFAMTLLEPGWQAMAMDLSYLALVIIILVRELHLGQNRRNYIIAA
ncbi:MAG: NnrS family protein, partial [Gammaproteobacteria bacterium]|nr:NnrS family protein [Gammaproteobacteria bacterium]